MSKDKKLAARIAVGMAAVALVGASAFADSRPSDETRARRDGRSESWRSDVRERSESRRGDDSREERGENAREQSARQQSRDSRRGDDRSAGVRRDERSASGESGSRVDVYGGRSAEVRRDDRGRADRRDDGWRGDDRRGSDRRRDDRRYDTHRGRTPAARQPYYAHGRVNRISPYNGGYRVWIVGSPYPFFVPAAYYRDHRLRVGVTIRLGGYYNPLGYYDYYDGRGYSGGFIRGVVESVDYRRDMFVVRNEATGSFVTVVNRERRRDVRPGDYVELSGDWTRSGLFEARYVDLADYRYRR